MLIKIHRVPGSARYIATFARPHVITPAAKAAATMRDQAATIRKIYSGYVYAEPMTSADGAGAGPDAPCHGPGSSSRPALRVDAERNRQRLITAAREMFA